MEAQADGEQSDWGRLKMTNDEVEGVAIGYLLRKAGK
jgi:hypothetical protein